MEAKGKEYFKIQRIVPQIEVLQRDELGQGLKISH